MKSSQGMALLTRGGWLPESQPRLNGITDTSVIFVCIPEIK